MRRRYINPLINALCLVTLATLLAAVVLTAIMTTWDRAINLPTGGFVLALIVFAALTWKSD